MYLELTVPNTGFAEGKGRTHHHRRALDYPRFLRSILAAGAVLCLVLPAAAYDQTYFVNQRNDAPDFNLLDGVPDSKEFEPGLQTTVRAALMQAAFEGGTTLITLSSGVHTNFDQQFINGNITLRGLGPDETVIDGNHVSRVISVGDVYDRTNYTVRIEGLTLRNGTLSILQNGQGTGILNWWSTVTLSNVVVEGNASTGGDAQYSYGGGIVNLNVMTLQHSLVQSNLANGNGGGIYNHGHMDIYDSTLRGNQGASGGGLYNYSGTCNFSGSTLVDNQAGAHGGGIYNNSGSSISYLNNSTISGNSAVVRGGGIYNDYGGCVLRHVTLAFNEAPGGNGGGIYQKTAHPYAGATLQNTLLAHNIGGSIAGVTSNVDDDGGNLSTDGAAGVPTGNPVLGALADNTGPTLTHALLAGSDAIDAGDPAYALSVDQRGVSRPQDGDGDAVPVCDIGAYEADGIPPLPAPEIDVRPMSHDFGVLEVHTNSTPLEIVIENTGSLTLNITGISVSDTTHYSLDLNGGSDPAGSSTPSIPVGQQRTVTVTFAPQAEGNLPCELNIASDDADENPVIVSLVGAATEPPEPPTLAVEHWNGVEDSGYGHDYMWGVTLDSTGTLIAAGYRQANEDPQDQTAKLVKYGPEGWVDEMEMGSNYWDKPHSNDQFYDVVTDTNDNIIVVGQKSGTWTEGYLGRMVTRKYSPTGTLLWERLLPNSGYWSAGRGIALTDEGNILVAGSSYLDNEGRHQWAVMGYEGGSNALTGFPIIYKHYPTAPYEYAWDTAVGESNQFVVVGFVGNADGNYDWHVRAYGEDLLLDWSDTVNGSSNLNDSAQGCAATPDGNFVVGGYSNKGTDNGAGSDHDWLIKKYRGTDGELLWTTTADSPSGGSDICYDVAVDGVGNVLCAGFARDALDTACWFLLRLDGETGQIIGEQRWPAEANQVIYALAYRDRVLAFGGWANNGSDNDARVALADPPPATLSSTIGSGGNLLLQWEGAFEAATVHSTPSLNPAQWQVIVPAQIESEATVDPGTNTSQFFRIAE